MAPTLNELGRDPTEDCIGLAPSQRLRTSPRTDDYENITEGKLRVWLGLLYAAARRMRPDASAATPSADSQEARQKPVKRNAGRTRERTSSTFPSKRGTVTTVARTTLRGDGPALRVERSPESGASSISGVAHKETRLAASEFCRGCGPGTTQSSSHLADESRSQADSEATDVKIDEDSSQDRDKGNSKEVANKVKDLNTSTRQFHPCAKDEGVTALSEEKKQERDELEIQLQNHKPLHHRFAPGHRGKGEGQQRSGGRQAGKRRTSWSLEPSSLRRSISSRPRFCSRTTLSNSWS